MILLLQLFLTVISYNIGYYLSDKIHIAYLYGLGYILGMLTLGILLIV